jgi:putative polyhydroxyalkanoate system protein
MTEIVVRRRHNLRLAGARRMAETMARRLRDEYGGSYSWKGDRLIFQRTGASGHVVVTREDLEIRVALGLLLTPVRARIEREIHAFCDERFGNAGMA